MKRRIATISPELKTDARITSNLDTSPRSDALSEPKQEGQSYDSRRSRRAACYAGIHQARRRKNPIRPGRHAGRIQRHHLRPRPRRPRLSARYRQRGAFRPGPRHPPACRIARAQDRRRPPRQHTRRAAVQPRLLRLAQGERRRERQVPHGGQSRGARLPHTRCPPNSGSTPETCARATPRYSP